MNRPVGLLAALCVGTLAGSEMAGASAGTPAAASTAKRPAEKKIQPKKVASVGKDVITDCDILSRCRLLAFMSHIPCSDEFIHEARDQIKQRLIDEAVYEQMAEQFNIVPETSSVRATFEDYAQSVKLSLTAFENKLREMGCYDSCLALVRANIIGSYIYMSAVPKDLLRFSEQQIQRKKRELEAAQKEKQYEVLEIVCYTDSKGNAASKIQKVLSKLETMRKEMPPVHAFQECVALYSQGPSAKRNGYLGWVGLARFDKSSKRALTNMSVGSCSAAIQTRKNECRLLFLNDIKNPGFVPLRQSALRVATVTIPFSQKTPKEEEAVIQRRIPALLSCKSPEELHAVAKDFGYKFEYTNTTLGQAEFMRTATANQCQQPIFTGEALVIPMLVSRTTPKVTDKIDEEDIIRQLEHQKKTEQTEKIIKDFRLHIAIRDHECTTAAAR